jgi:hypothetical protein
METHEQAFLSAASGLATNASGVVRSVFSSDS